MKKTLVALGVVAVTAVAAPTVIAQQVTGGTNRVVGTANAKTTATVKKSVVVYQTSGTVLFPAGSKIFAPGVTDPAYGRDPVCNGNVRVTVYRGGINGRRLNRKTVPLARTCTFATSNTVSRKKAYGKTTVAVAYLGGTDIVADTAPSQSFTIKKLKKKKNKK